MSKNNNKIVRSKRIEVVTKNGDIKKVNKPSHTVFLRLSEQSHKAILEQNSLTGLSINSIISLCVDLQLNNLPNYKIDNIAVSFLDSDGESKTIKYSGNSLNMVSPLKKKGK